MSLDCHSLPVKDIGWSPCHASEVLTCADDGYIYLWDIRTPESPSGTMMTGGAAAPSLVRWHRSDEWTFASVHEKTVSQVGGGG